MNKYKKLAEEFIEKYSLEDKHRSRSVYGSWLMQFAKFLDERGKECPLNHDIGLHSGKNCICDCEFCKPQQPKEEWKSACCNAKVEPTGPDLEGKQHGVCSKCEFNVEPNSFKPKRIEKLPTYPRSNDVPVFHTREQVYAYLAEKMNEIIDRENEL